MDGLHFEESNCFQIGSNELLVHMGVEHLNVSN